MSELLPCPFCGGKAHWPEPEVNIPYVGCTECGACTQDEVRWNTRAALTSCQFDKMREALAVAEEKLGLISATAWDGPAKRYGNHARAALPVVQEALAALNNPDERKL